jgi:hypothetical protein
VDVEEGRERARPGEALAGAKATGADVRRDGARDLAHHRRRVGAVDGEGQGPAAHWHIDNVRTGTFSSAGAAACSRREGRSLEMRRYWAVWEGARGLAAIFVALALWAWVLAGVAAPLGAALTRLGAATP